MLRPPPSLAWDGVVYGGARLIWRGQQGGRGGRGREEGAGSKGGYRGVAMKWGGAQGWLGGGTVRGGAVATLVVDKDDTWGGGTRG